MRICNARMSRENITTLRMGLWCCKMLLYIRVSFVTAYTRSKMEPSTAHLADRRIPIQQLVTMSPRRSTEARSEKHEWVCVDILGCNHVNKEQNNTDTILQDIFEQKKISIAGLGFTRGPNTLQRHLWAPWQRFRSRKTPKPKAPEPQPLATKPSFVSGDPPTKINHGD